MVNEGSHAKVDMARCELITDHPFFGMLTLMLEPKAVENLGGHAGGPLATDGRYLYYDPNEIDKWTTDEVLGGMVHEVLHLAFGHTNGHSYNRTGSRDPMKWNVACDLLINELIRGSRLTLPSGALDYRSFEFKLSGGKKGQLGKGIDEYTAEELYPLIPDPDHSPECGLMNPMTGQEDRQSGTGGSGPKAMSDVDREIWHAKLVAAAEQAKRQGNLPAGLEEIIDGLRPPVKNWKEELAAFIQRVYEDFTYMPPDRRAEAISEEIGEEVILPSLSEGELLMDLVIAVDTSGSVSHEQLVEFLSEVSAIAMSGVNLILAYCDADVHYWGELTMENIPHPKGRGGTSFVPVLDRVEKEGIRPECLVYFTDGWGDFGEEPDYPVIWVINNDETDPPYGSVIRYPSQEEEGY